MEKAKDRQQRVKEKELLSKPTLILGQEDVELLSSGEGGPSVYTCMPTYANTVLCVISDVLNRYGSANDGAIYNMFINNHCNLFAGEKSTPKPKRKIVTVKRVKNNKDGKVHEDESTPSTAEPKSDQDSQPERHFYEGGVSKVNSPGVVGIGHQWVGNQNHTIKLSVTPRVNFTGLHRSIGMTTIDVCTNK